MKTSGVMKMTSIWKQSKNKPMANNERNNNQAEKAKSKMAKIIKANGEAKL